MNRQPARPHSVPRVSTSESSRIAFLQARDGDAAALAWVKQTLAIYRRSVLNPSHFASSAGYRRLFLESCAEFRCWLGNRR